MLTLNERLRLPDMCECVRVLATRSPAWCLQELKLNTNAPITVILDEYFMMCILVLSLGRCGGGGGGVCACVRVRVCLSTYVCIHVLVCMHIGLPGMFLYLETIH